MTDDTCSSGRTACGSLHLFEKSTGSYIAAIQTSMAGLASTEYIVVGSGDTIPGAIRGAAESIEDDAEGLRWTDYPKNIGGDRR